MTASSAIAALWLPVARRFSRHHAAIVGAAVLGVLIVAALVAPPVVSALGLDPAATDLARRFQPPSGAHPLGTDELGRDVLARLLFGARVSLAVGFSAAFATALIGTTIGLAAGYFGGRLDAVLMRVTDGVIALPLLPLLIVLAAVDPEKLGLPRAFAESESASGRSCSRPGRKAPAPGASCAFTCSPTSPRRSSSPPPFRPGT